MKVTRPALVVWRRQDAKQKREYLFLALRGWLRRKCFSESHVPLVGRNVFLQQRFGKILLGDFVRLHDHVGLSVFGLDATHHATLRIGDYTNVGARTHINCSRSIIIGKRCAISWDCEILDTDIHTIVFQDGTKSAPAPVVIEDDVWLGTRVIVLKGVQIGVGAVIGAGSVVTQDIPPHCLAVGNPARPLREIREWLH